MMEVSGMGIIDASALYGLSTIADEVQIDLSL